MPYIGAFNDSTEIQKEQLDNLSIEFTTDLHVKDGGITHEKLANESVNTNNLFDRCITAIKLAFSIITTLFIADGAVTNPKLANDAVSEIKIQNDAVTTSKIADNNVSNSKILSVASSKITGILANALETTYIKVNDIYEYTVSHGINLVNNVSIQGILDLISSLKVDIISAHSLGGVIAVNSPLVVSGTFGVIGNSIFNGDVETGDLTVTAGHALFTDVIDTISAVVLTIVKAVVVSGITSQGTNSFATSSGTNVIGRDAASVTTIVRPSITNGMTANGVLNLSATVGPVTMGNTNNTVDILADTLTITTTTKTQFVGVTKFPTTGATASDFNCYEDSYAPSVTWALGGSSGLGTVTLEVSRIGKETTIGFPPISLTSGAAADVDALCSLALASRYRPKSDKHNGTLIKIGANYEPGIIKVDTAGNITLYRGTITNFPASTAIRFEGGSITYLTN